MSKNSIQGLDDARRAVTAEDMRSLVQLPDLQSFMQRVIEQATAKADKAARSVAAAVPAAAASVPAAAAATDLALLRRDYEMAFNLLQRASEAVPVLTRQCERLEEEVRQIKGQSQADLAAAHGAAQQWHDRAVALNEKLDASEREREALRQRLESAETEVAEVRRQIGEAEHQASIAVGISTLFHDKIVAAFGVGSQAHPTLDLIAKGEVEPR